MSWANSNRRQELPTNWNSLAASIRKRDGHRCTWEYRVEDEIIRCTATERLEVDHRIPGDDHSPENLRTLCHAHHAQKTQRESWQARSANLARAKKKFRRNEEHPALAYMKRPTAT